MAVHFYRHSWGAVGPTAAHNDLPALVYAAAAAGYQAVEVPFSDLDGAVDNEGGFRAALAETGLAFFPLIQTGAQPRSDATGHLQHLRILAHRAAGWGASAAAVHTGDDSFDDATARRFFRDAASIARDEGIEPYFETHRGRPMFDPWRTARLLEALPDIWLTADFAHWIPVLERLPDELDDLLALCAARTGHIHARVAFEEGGQVPDPRDPRWARHLEWHEHWWDQCVAAAGARGADIAITPEFGPFPFLLPRPYSEEPLADLAAVVAWMHQRLRLRYTSFI